MLMSAYSLELKRNKTVSHWYLDFGRTSMSLAEMYLVNDKPDGNQDCGSVVGEVIDHQTSDIRTPLDDKKIRYWTSTFEISKDRLLTCAVYLKFHNEKSLFGHLILTTPQSFLEKTLIETSSMGIYLGALLLMACFNLNAFFVTKDHY